MSWYGITFSAGARVANAIGPVAIESDWWLDMGRISDDAILSPQSEVFNNGAIAFDIIFLDVVEQSATATDQHQKTSAGMVVFFVHFQMFGQVSDPMGQETDLNFWRSRIAIM
jgi:hypothetical protein